MRRFRTWFPAVLIAVWLVGCLCMPTVSLHGAGEGLKLFASAVLPALLPYFILTRALLDMDALRPLRPAFGALGRFFFRLGPDAAAAWPLAWLGGSPSGARICGLLLREEKLDDAQAVRFLSVSCCVGPVFLVGTVGAALLGDAQTGVVLLAAHWLSAVMNGILWRSFGGPPPQNREAPQNQDRKGFLSAIASAIPDSALAMLGIAAAMALFGSASALLEDSGFYDVLGRFIDPLVRRDILEAVCSGVLEISAGMQKLSVLPLHTLPRLLLIGGVAGFGGVSVLGQAALFLPHRILPAYIGQRLSHAALACGCTWCLLCLLRGNWLPGLLLCGCCGAAGFVSAVCGRGKFCGRKQGREGDQKLRGSVARETFS